MTSLRPAVDASAADWLLDAEVTWSTLVRFGPPGFDVYLRVAFTNDRDSADTPEAPDALRHVIALLTRRTAPATGYAAVWEGWISGPGTPTAPELAVPNRRMLFFSGPLDLLRDAPALAWKLPGQGAEPALVWPDDRSWCVACDVDEEVEFTVGCTTEAAAELTAALGDQVRQVSYGDALS